METFTMINKRIQFCLLAISLSIGAVGSACSESLQGFDLAGVKIGMTADEATAALKHFDPEFQIFRNMHVTNYYEYGSFGFQEDKLPSVSDGLRPEYAYFTDMVAEHGIPNCEENMNNPCGDNSQPFDFVHIWFSPVIGEERVVAISRDISYFLRNGMPFGDESVQPRATAVIDSIKSKYGDPSYFELKNTQEFVWLFDKNGNMFPSNTNYESKRYYHGLLPGEVGPKTYPALSVALTLAGPGNVQRINSSLFDGAAIYKSVEQGQNTYKSQMQKMMGYDESHSNGVKPKF
jgi:hypothetical protein